MNLCMVTLEWPKELSETRLPLARFAVGVGRVSLKPISWMNSQLTVFGHNLQPFALAHHKKHSLSMQAIHT